jgi:hypothetical protein
MTLSPRVILPRFRAKPRALTEDRASAFGRLLTWLTWCIKPCKNIDKIHSIGEGVHTWSRFGDELGYDESVVLKVRHIYKSYQPPGREIFTQLSFWIEEMYGVILEPNVIRKLSVTKDVKDTKWKVHARQIQEEALEEVEK